QPAAKAGARAGKATTSRDGAWGGVPAGGVQMNCLRSEFRASGFLIRVAERESRNTKPVTLDPANPSISDQTMTSVRICYAKFRAMKTLALFAALVFSTFAAE